MSTVRTPEPAVPLPEPALHVGPAVGALFVHAGRELTGMAVALTTTGEPVTRQQATVQAWSVNGRAINAAVFTGLPKGTYDLWLDDDLQRPGLVVCGAYVTEITWMPVD